MEKALIYTRVSTTGQNEYSPETQLKSCQEYAAGKFEIVDVISETGSAYEADKRPKYLAMIKRLSKEHIPHLIFYLPDRIARNLDDWIPLRNIGVRLHDAVKNDSFNPVDKKDYKKVRDFERNLINATESSDDTRQRVTDAWVTQYGKGRYPHLRPAGYTSEPRLIGGQWIKVTVQDQRAPIVRRLFNHILVTQENNKTKLTRIAKDLGLRSKTDRILTVQEVTNIIRDPWYYGVMKSKKTGKLYPNQGNYQPLITKNEYDRVQEILGGKRVVRRGKDFRYKGLLTCSECGKPFTGDEQVTNLKDGSQNVHRYYHCYSPGCQLSKKPYFKESELDRAFGVYISELYIDEKTYQWIKGELEADYRHLKAMRAEEVEALTRELAELNSKESFIIHRMPKANPLVLETYERELVNLGTRRAEAKVRLESIKTGEEAVSLDDMREVLEFSKDLKNIYLQADPEKRRKLNNLMFRTVIIHPEKDFILLDDEDSFVTFDRYDFRYNQPFLDLAKKGFVKGIEKAKARFEQQGNTPEMAENKMKRA